MHKSKHFFLLLMLVASFISGSVCENKYSRSANEKKPTEEKIDVDFRKLDRPFRMNKLNMVWIKAQQRLSEPKLKSLYSDLMLQDKEELIYKKVKGEGGDKEGLKEAELRRKLTNIMELYGLREHFEDNVARQKHLPAHNSVIDDHINRSIFKDKKLSQLWAKAESSGFTLEELSALKEEFLHHQEKIDQYYDLLANLEDHKNNEGFKNAVDDEELANFNEVKMKETNEVPNKEKDYQDKSNMLKNKHRDLKDGFDRLHRIAAKGPDNREFIEPKVLGLWKIALEAKFTPDELESLRVELQHYESRLLKLRTLHADHVRILETQHAKLAATGDKMDHFDHHQQMLKKHSRKVEKMHADLETRILTRHNEL